MHTKFQQALRQIPYLCAICAGEVPVALDFHMLTEHAGEDARRLVWYDIGSRLQQTRAGLTVHGRQKVAVAQSAECGTWSTAQGGSIVMRVLHPGERRGWASERGEGDSGNPHYDRPPGDRNTG